MHHSMHQQLKLCFLVHLRKITRVPPLLPSPDMLKWSKTALTSTLRVTVLYDTKQMVLGDFAVLNNECIIDQQLVCQLNFSKPGAQSKIYFFIDQACNSGLAGHMALDLKEFISEGDSEVYLKYPLYANSSAPTGGPTLKMTIQRMDKGAELFLNDDSDCFVLQKPSFGTRQHGLLDRLQCHPLVHDNSLIRDDRARLQRLDETGLIKLAGALSDLDKRLKGLAAVYENTEYVANNNDRDVYLEPENSVYHPPTNLRALSDIGRLSSRSQCFQAFGHKRNISINEIVSDFQSRLVIDEEYDHQKCEDNCFMCSSSSSHVHENSVLSASGSNSVCSSPRLHLQDKNLTDRLFLEVDSTSSKPKGEKKKADPKKGSGLLRRLFGAVVVAGVSLLGAKNTSMGKKDRPRDGNMGKLSWTGSFNRANNTRGRALRDRFYSPRFSI